MTLELIHFLAVAAILFMLGIIAIISRQNAIGILIGVELMLNAANLNLIAFARFSDAGMNGQVFALFVILLAACEAAVGVALIINLFARFGDIDIHKADTTKH